MKQSCFQSSAWYTAITLSERIESLHAIQSTRPNIEINTEFSQQQMQRWKSQSPFTDDSYFAQRLAIDGITEDEFLYILGEPTSVVQDRFPKRPYWLTKIAEAFASPNLSSIPLKEELQSKEVAGFLDAIKPLINQGRERLHQEVQSLIQTHANLPFDPNTVENLLFANLPGQLLSLLSRTMVLELNVARLQGLLSGNTPEERFQSFLQRLRQS